MSQIPESIVLRRDRDLATRGNEIWVRRGLLALICVVPILALLNVFGQRPVLSTAGAPAARLSISAPSRVRGGLLYQARFDIVARKTIKHAALVLSSGWLQGLTFNSIEPSPSNQTSLDGNLSLGLGQISAGSSQLLFVYFQVNPINFGLRDQTATLYDGNKALVTIHRTLTIFP